MNQPAPARPLVIWSESRSARLRLILWAAAFVLFLITAWIGFGHWHSEAVNVHGWAALGLAAYLLGCLI